MAIKAKQFQPAKTAAIADMKACFESAKDFIFTEYRGLTVEQITDLRAKLREKDCTYKVVKNTFARIAFTEMEKADLGSGVAKVLFDFAKDVPALVVKGGLIGGELYDAGKLEEFSKLPGKKELIAMLMSAMQATTSKLARTLQAVADKKSEEASA